MAAAHSGDEGDGDDMFFGVPADSSDEEGGEGEGGGSHHVLTELGLSAAEYHACVKVMGALTPDRVRDDVFFKGFRKALMPFVEELQARMYGGGSKADYQEGVEQRVNRTRRRQRQAALDKKKINSQALRQKRLDALKQLEQDGRPKNLAIVGVPDGVGDDSGAAASAALLGGEADAQEGEELEELLRSCYTCKCRYTKLHFFYDQLCPSCADLNFAKRNQSVDLSGKVAIVTGGRVKIGYQTALKLLRCGAFVVVTTRFPHNAARRFSQEEDFAAFEGRLHIRGLDLRHFASVEAFCVWFEQTHARLDILINNACQTIRRPPAYYAHMIQEEENPTLHFPQVQMDGVAPILAGASPAAGPQPTEAPEAASTARPKAPAAGEARVMSSAALSMIPLVAGDERGDPDQFPLDTRDINGQQLDLRPENSWLLKLGEVSTAETAEVFAINAISPFILNGRLKHLMLNHEGDKFIINVSAMEGKFYRYKTPNHPHTNMAKAALNMMTRTSAEDFAKDGIFMNSVDTGWINDENPLDRAARIAKEQNFQTPIDEIDAAARILDPVMRALQGGDKDSGLFFKDYVESAW